MSRKTAKAVARFEQWTKTAVDRLGLLKRTATQTGAHALPGHIPAPPAHLLAPAARLPAPAQAAPAGNALKQRLAQTIHGPSTQGSALRAAPAAPAAAPRSVTSEYTAGATTLAPDAAAAKKAMRAKMMRKLPVDEPTGPAPAAALTQARARNSAMLRSATESSVMAPPTSTPFASGRTVVAPSDSIMKPVQRARDNIAAGVQLDPAAVKARQHEQALASLPLDPDAAAKAAKAAEKAKADAAAAAARAAETPEAPAWLQRHKAVYGSAGSDGAVMRKMEFAGIPISIETDVGQARTWKDPKSGEDRATIMRFPYGFIPDTEGMDDGSVDVFVGPVTDAPNAYVICINKPPTFETMDEEKVFLGFSNIYDAIGAFLQHYGNQEKFIRKVNVIPVAELAKSLKEDKKTGTAEGATKTETRVKREPELEQDPTSRIVEALEEPQDAPKIDEDAVKKVAFYLRDKIASEQPSRIDEDLVRQGAAYLTAKIASDLRRKVAAEPASTSIPGFAPSTVTTESAGPEDLKVSPCVPDNTIWKENEIENMFRNVESNAMQTDHMIDPGQITSSL